MSKPLHIVVLDDEQAIEMLFKAFFDEEISENKVRITYVDLAQKCLDLLDEDTSVGLILSDINMPQMNGFEFLEKVNASHPEIPVYMISAYGTPEYVNKAKEKGASEFFVKPFDFDEIKEKIESLIQE